MISFPIPMSRRFSFTLSLSLSLSLLILCAQVRARFLSSSSDLVSDGIHDFRDSPEDNLLRFSLPLTESTCDQTYGFLPCTTSVVGNLFLIIVYGFLMYKAATYLSCGSELLLEILGPGIVGGLFLPILGALPDAMLILVSGLSGSTETAQKQVSVGMGLLAGSTVLLLTIIWGTCVIVGKCDIEDSIAKDSQDTRGFSLIGSGVSTDIWTSYAARIMVISVIPFLIVQIPQILKSTSGRHLAVLIGLIVSLCLLVSYCLYQVFQPWIQRRRLAYVKLKHVIFGILRHFTTREQTLGRLLREDGEPDREIIKKLFSKIDENGDGELSYGELRALVIGIGFDEIDLDHDDAVTKIIEDFDTSRNSHIDEYEFFNGISRWLSKAKRSRWASSGDTGHRTMKFLSDLHQETKREHDLLDVGGPAEEAVEGVENAKWNTIKAVLLLLLGTVIAAAFADPLVDAVDEFSDVTSIPAFFISFIVLPLATNASEAVSAIIFASREKRQTASLTFSELYGAVTMNNVLCLAVFLALVYIRELTWDFSSEVLVILVVCVVMGVFASFRTTFPLWTSIVAILLYPFSLALVYVLDYVCGWS
ncbi:sodium/calcium exchanger NCL-like [Prosopis cineraria]|uniref:sodium/calcium exchanger NCL-like n=1 Tax=Prosopis cineraria TaxID=364024 RepID=UPI00240FE799|nr:sodium/calcium exchanger NCL-like [Prosopis cineraria]